MRWRSATQKGQRVEKKKMERTSDTIFGRSLCYRWTPPIVQHDFSCDSANKQYVWFATVFYVAYNGLRDGGEVLGILPVLDQEQKRGIMS